MKFKVLITILLLSISTSIIAINENSGTTGFAFLKTSFGARSSALGTAYTGLSDDVEAVYYNAAGLLQLKQSQSSATYVNYFDGINCGSIVYVSPLNANSAFGVFGQFLSASEDKTLMDASGNYSGTDGTFGMSNILLGVSYAYDIMPILDIGVTVKYLREDLDEHVGSAIAADLSLMHQTTNPNLKLGIAVKNIGTQIEYYSNNEYEENLPAQVTVGFKLQARNQLIFIGDLLKPLDGDIGVNLGGEYQIHEMFAIRLGYKTNASDWKTGGDLDPFAGMSGGFGVDWKQFNLSYSIASFGDLGFINQLSLLYKF